MGIHLLTMLTFLLVIFSACVPNSRTSDAQTERQVERTKSQLDSDFGFISEAVRNLSIKTQNAYANKKSLIPKARKNQYKTAPNGVFYSKPNVTKSDAWISSYKKITPEAKDVAYLTESLEEDLQNIVTINEAIVQAYYNSKDSLCRIFPPVDALNTFDPKMNIPTFNFYYLADEKHNPEKKVVWVDLPYLDPAGRGFMISAIAPVYEKNKLEGVAGVDIKLATIMDKYSRGENKGIVLVHQSGLLVSASNHMAELLNLPPYKENEYKSTVSEDTYQPDEYDLSKNKSPNVKNLLAKCNSSKILHTNYQKDDKTYNLSCSSLESIHWLVLAFDLTEKRSFIRLLF